MDIPKAATPKKSMCQALEEWAAKPKMYVAPEQLAACRANPSEGLTILGPDAIPCLLCGYCEKKLDRHLRGAHGLRSAAYKRECKKNWGATWPADVEAEVLCPNLLEKYTSQVGSIGEHHENSVASRHTACNGRRIRSSKLFPKRASLS